MLVTVLGCGAVYARAGGACAGFLVQGEGATVWIDAGNGTLSNLQKHVSFHDVDALVLSHRHADHIADVIPLMYARGLIEISPRPLTVYAPNDVVPSLLAGQSDMARDMFGDVFSLSELAGPFEVGGLRLEPFRTVHPVPTYGIRASEAGRAFVYTADTAAFEELAGHCGGADLLVCEATYVDGMTSDPGIHLWAREAGEVGAKAEPGRLVLTHIWPTIDPARSVEEAAEAFPGVVEAAAEGDVYDV